MSRKTWIACAIVVILLFLSLLAPTLLLHQQTRAALSHIERYRAEQSVFLLEDDVSSLYERLALSVDEEAVSSWLAQAMVEDRFGRHDQLSSQLLREMRRLLGTGADALLNAHTDLNILYYYHPVTQRSAAFLSCYYVLSDGYLSVEMDLKSETITALDFWYTAATPTGPLLSLSNLISSSDFPSRWASYLTIPYQGVSGALHCYGPDGEIPIAYQYTTDGQSYSWRPVSCS